MYCHTSKILKKSVPLGTSYGHNPVKKWYWHDITGYINRWMSVKYGYIPVFISSWLPPWWVPKWRVHGRCHASTSAQSCGWQTNKPTVLHPAGQSEAEVHLDVVVKGPVVCRGIGTEWAIPVCDIPLDDPASVNQTVVLLHLSCGGRADYIIKPDIPILSVVWVGCNYPALDTAEDVDNISALNGPGLGALLQDPHHSFFPQDIVSGLDRLLIFAGR